MHLGDPVREVAHLDDVDGPYRRELPLADGSLWLEIEGEVYEIPAP